MKLKPLVTFGETANVKERIYARKSKEEVVYKNRSEGLFCIDYPINKPYYLLGTDFETTCGDIEEISDVEEQFSICLDSYYEDLKKNPKILTKEAFFNYFNENYEDFSDVELIWRDLCREMAEELLESFDKVLLEVAPIEHVIKKCDFSLYVYNPIIFYEELLTLSKERNIPVSVIVMNDLWDNNDEYTGCLERMKAHLMMYSALEEKSVPLETFLNKEKQYSVNDIYFNEVKRFCEIRLKDEYNKCKHCEDRFTCDHNFYWQYIEEEKEKRRIEQQAKKKQKKPKKKKVQEKPKKIRNIDKELEKVLIPEEPKVIEEPIKEPVYVPKESLEIVKPAKVELKEDYFHSMNMNRREQRKSSNVAYQSYLKDESLMKVSKRKISKLNLSDNFMNRFKTNN